MNDPIGDLDGEHRSLSLQSNGQLEMQQLIVSFGSPLINNGASALFIRKWPMPLDSEENTRVVVSSINRQEVLLNYSRQPGTNTISTVVGACEC